MARVRARVRVRVRLGLGFVPELRLGLWLGLRVRVRFWSETCSVIKESTILVKSPSILRKNISMRV